MRRVGMMGAAILVTVLALRADATSPQQEAMVFSAAAMPQKYNKMPLGWFFYNVAMTEAYAVEADVLTNRASGRLFRVAADKESAALLEQYDADIAKEKKGKKQNQKIQDRNAFLEQNLSKVDTTKSLDDSGKKELGLALLETAVALRMEQLVVKGGTYMVNNISNIQAEAKSSGNPLAVAKTSSKVAAAGTSLPNTVTSAKNGIVRLEKISKLLVELGKHNKINPPTEKETAAAEKNYVSEIKLED